jgi:hypothetical protein
MVMARPIPRVQPLEAGQASYQYQGIKEQKGCSSVRDDCQTVSQSLWFVNRELEVVCENINHGFLPIDPNTTLECFRESN